ncbi:Putative acyl-coenzyme A synthetase [Cladobotryum mycophilum]|uniref:Acyl-coenzyme A synthetase n=1 Tax=Cladobotryum mycophilum TaxID=491253 RepID=A0ABR0SMX3_9HYPO
MIYNEGNSIPVPNLDILTYLFESEHCAAKEDTPLFAEAKDPQKVLTKAQLRDLTKQIAYFFRHTYGIGKLGPAKDVVVTVSTGQSALATIFYGVIAADGIYSAAAPAATESDLTRQIKDGPGQVIVCSKDRKELAVNSARAAGLPARNVLILESYPEIKLYSADGTVVCDFKGSLDWRRITDPKELETSKICILYSSGTTGLPKGVLISHLNLTSETYIPATKNRIEWERLGINFPKSTLAHLPTAHIAGIMGYFVGPFNEAGITYWMPAFNFNDFVKYCGELKITFFFTVPPIYMAIAKHPSVTNQFKHVEYATSGAAPLSRELQLAASDKLLGHVNQVWGLSETTGAVTQTLPGRTDAIGSLSPLMPNVTLRLVDDDEKDVEPGQPGEALLKGPMITQGYHNNPEANKNSFTADGWFKTGDIIKVEGDLLYIVDRKKELIKYKGIQVAPAELEGVLTAHSAIADAAVIGIELEDTEVPIAYVVLAPPARGKFSEDDVIKYVASKVADYKRLRGGVKFLDAIPRSAAGKILRKDLRALHKREAKI